MTPDDFNYFFKMKPLKDTLAHPGGIVFKEESSRVIERVGDEVLKTIPKSAVDGQFTHKNSNNGHSLKFNFFFRDRYNERNILHWGAMFIIKTDWGPFNDKGNKDFFYHRLFRTADKNTSPKNSVTSLFKDLPFIYDSQPQNVALSFAVRTMTPPLWVRRYHQNMAKRAHKP